MTFTSHFHVCQFWRQLCAILQYSMLIMTRVDLGISWIIQEKREQLEKKNKKPPGFTRCLCQGLVMDLPSNTVSTKKTFWFAGPHTVHAGVVSVLHARRSGCSPFVSESRVLCRIRVPSHIPTQNLLSRPGGRKSSTFSACSCGKQTSKEDGTAVDILHGDNQCPSRSTFPTQLYNSLCSLEGTAPYVQFPSYI